MAEPKTVVSVNNITKTFKIPTEVSSGIKQKLINAFKGKKGYREFTPLNDVSFDIKEGEFFGIVGRNGSGKSTLLKTIAKIYTPTSGSVEVKGSLIPFIELGVGFNPELTGRENVFLNGALLGFSRAEVEAMYDEIVEFAEIRDFMDEKLKNYSSGMQVRLAFSIAIKAEGEILLLDEVLAVGDEAFQRKCFDYFEKLRSEGRTVILVTHDMKSVKRFCTRAILIENGSIKMQGTPEDIANQYTLDNFSSDEGSDEKTWKEGMVVSGSVDSIRIIPKSPRVIAREGVLEFDVEYSYTGSREDLYMGIMITYNHAAIIEHGNQQASPTRESDGYVAYTYRLPLDRFTQGDFIVSASIRDKKEKALVAFTNEKGNFTFSIVNKEISIGGMLIDRGEWV